jgi:mRNA interferase MazF
MTTQRGDVILAWYPFASGAGNKRRPCVVVQNDEDNRKLSNTVVAQITSNLARAADKSHFLIAVGTQEGKQSGLLHDSLVSSNNLATIEDRLIDQVIGSLDPVLVQQLNACLKAALEIP